MRVHLISDIHLDHGPYIVPPDLDFDVLVVAGDLDEVPERGVEFLKTASRGKPCVFVLGNHDLWEPCSKSFFDRAPEAPKAYDVKLAEWRAAADSVPNLHLLENDQVIIDGVRFLGCTLWTSYAKGNLNHMRIAERVMNDFLYIGAGNWFAEHLGAIEAYAEHVDLPAASYLKYFRPERFHPLIAADLHKQSLAWLDQELRADGDWERTVVVTHHAPSWEVLTAGQLVDRPIKELTSLDHMARVRGQTSNFDRMDRDTSDLFRLGCYASPLENFLRHSCANVVWMHGHTHAHTDLAIGQCRVVCNPRGYAFGENYGNAGNSPLFDERFIVHPEDGVHPVLNDFIEDAIPKLKDFAVKLKALRPHVNHRNRGIREAVRERAHRLSDEISSFVDEIAGFVHASLGNDSFGVPGRVLRLPGANWKARTPPPAGFNEVLAPGDTVTEFGGIEDFPEFADRKDEYRKECNDGRIGQMLVEIRALISDLARVPTWHTREYVSGGRKALKPAMDLLSELGAKPKLFDFKRLCCFRIEVESGFAQIDLRPLDQLGFNFWLIEREDSLGTKPAMSAAEIDALVKKRAAELGLGVSPWCR